MWNPFSSTKQNAAYAAADDRAAAYAAKYYVPAAEKLEAVSKRLEQLTKRVDCVEKYGDHDWEFVERTKQGISVGDLQPLLCYTITMGTTAGEPTSEGPFIYQCVCCGHRRGFHWDELSKDEQDALTTIGLGE